MNVLPPPAALRMGSSLALYTFLASLTAAAPAEARDAVPPGWFEWPYAEAQPGTALDVSGLNTKPAGADGRVLVSGGRFVTEANGERLRFWGCNLSAVEAFPKDPATAKRLAKRLAQGGINIARLHHLDNPWAVDSAGSLWKPGTQDRIHIDPAQLAKLHHLVAALKAEGIYSNVNLKVSRTHTEADGFPPSIAQTPGFQKRVDYFSRRLVDLQKDYARQLLTAKNPHTGLSLADDPAVAVVEINNENSLLGLRTREAADGLELLPEPFRGELTALWNAWLSKRYADDATLAAAWIENATKPGESPLTPVSRWQADAQPRNRVSIRAADATAVEIEVGDGDGVRWRSAAFLDQLRFAEGETYTLTFHAKADQKRPADVTVSRDEPGWRTDKWRTRGLRAAVELTPEWKPFRMVFTTHSIVDVASRLSFILGHQTGKVWIKDLQLVSGSPTAGLREGQSPRAGTVPIPTDMTPAQWNDWLTFLVDTERSYVAELRAFLRDELKVKAPIVCTQANYGGIAGLAREQDSDFIDTHYYWQHPDFGGPTGVWNVAHWTIVNTPQLGEFTARWFGEIGGIALLRVAGKPFTVSEVDHPAPNDYACEMYPVLATFAGLQDWDGLYPFDYVDIGVEKDNGALKSFFDQTRHPAKWAFSAFATRVFRQGIVPPAKGSRELRVNEAFWREANHVDVLWLKHLSGRDLGFLTDRLSVSDRLLQAGESTRIVQHAPGEIGAVILKQEKRGPVYVASATAAAAIVGYVGGSRLDAGQLGIECDDFGLNFAAVTAIALDGKSLSESARTLVTLAGRAENQGMVWNAVRTSAGDLWNQGGPTIAERVPATVRIKTSGPSFVRALRPDGSSAGEVAAAWQNGWLTFSTREGPATLHYEVLRR